MTIDDYIIEELNAKIKEKDDIIKSLKEALKENSKIYTPNRLLKEIGFHYIETQYYDNLYDFITFKQNKSGNLVVDVYGSEDECDCIMLDHNNHFIHYEENEDCVITISKDLTTNPLFSDYKQIIIDDEPYYIKKGVNK